MTELPSRPKHPAGGAVETESSALPPVDASSGAERGRTLFEVSNLEPIDACRAEMLGREAVFHCAEGRHPSVRVRVENDAVVVATLSATDLPPSEERFAVPPGACVTLSASYQQFVPQDARQPDVHGTFDPFEGIAFDRSRVTPVRSSERCADAGAAGGTVEIRLRVPRHGSKFGATLAVPALGLTRPLGVGAASIPGEAWLGQLCEARVYPRSAIAVVRCYNPDNGTTQRSVFVEHDELLSQYKRLRGGPISDLLPCHAAVRFVVDDH